MTVKIQEAVTLLFLLSCSIETGYSANLRNTTPENGMCIFRDLTNLTVVLRHVNDCKLCTQYHDGINQFSICEKLDGNIDKQSHPIASAFRRKTDPKISRKNGALSVSSEALGFMFFVVIVYVFFTTFYCLRNRKLNALKAELERLKSSSKKANIVDLQVELGNSFFDNTSITSCSTTTVSSA